MKKMRKAAHYMRNNPAIGKYPDLFEKDDTPLVISDEEFAEWLDVHGTDGIYECNIDPELFESLSEELQEQIRDGNEVNRDFVVKELEACAEDWRKYETEGDGSTGTFEWLADEEIQRGDISEQGVLWNYKDELLTLQDMWREKGYSDDQIQDALEIAVRDVDSCWDFKWDSDSYHHGGDVAVSGSENSEQELYITWEDKDWQDELKAALLTLSKWDCEEVERRVDGCSVDGERLFKVAQEGRSHTTRYSSFYVNVWIGGAYTGNLNWSKVEELVERELTGVDPKDAAPEQDHVVYTYADDTYVADLEPGQLAAEGAELGICVGQKRWGYFEDVKKGRTKMYSIRTPARRSKFCIEAAINADGTVEYIRQIKGKGNRVPGFDDAEGRVGRFKSGEVEKVLEFVRFLGVNPRNILDLRPALQALGMSESQAVANPYRRRMVYNPALPVGQGHCAWCTREQPVRQNPAAKGRRKPYQPDSKGYAYLVRRRNEILEGLDKAFPTMLFYLDERSGNIRAFRNMQRMFEIAPAFNGKWMLIKPRTKDVTYFVTVLEVVKLATDIFGIQPRKNPAPLVATAAIQGAGAAAKKVGQAASNAGNTAATGLGLALGDLTSWLRSRKKK